MPKEKVVLAYSGGLDTSVILHWLVQKGYEVITYTGNVGQKEDFNALKEKALKLKSSKVYIEDLREEFIKDYIYPAIRANAAYEGRYLLGTALARAIVAKKQIEIAKKESATAVAHGSTGKGNDQARFEFVYHTFWPGIKIIAPWKDEEFLQQFKSREDEIRYAKEFGIPIKMAAKQWSIDDNIMHASYEGAELKDPMVEPKEEMFEMTVSPKDAPDEEDRIEIEFEKGDPIRARNLKNGEVIDGASELFEYLNEMGGKNGIGRVDMMENRFIGMKIRNIYENPAGTILHIAHQDLEGLTLDREVIRLKDALMPKFAELVYYGFWYSPEMEVLRTFFDKTQEWVTGKVRLILYKGNVIPCGRESAFSLYEKDLASFDVFAGDYNPVDGKGFVKINALRLIINALRKQKKC